MSATVPTWINESLLSTILEQNGGEKKREVIIKNFTTAMATAPGDNYTSFIVRVKVDYCCCVDREDDNDDEGVKQTSMIIKIPRHGELIKTLFGDLYKAEYSVYTELLPKLYDLLRTDRYFTPRLLYANSPYVMVLEDLTERGYVKPDKCKQLDYDHCVLCLTTLARFHAASVAAIHKYPGILDKVGPEFYYAEDKREVNKKKVASMSECFVNAVESWNVFDNFKERTKRIWEEITDVLIEIYKPRKSTLNVVSHGDFWTNNVMFRYDSAGRPVDVKLIDLQLCRYTSPVTDLQRFVFSSANDDVVEKRLPELMDVYRDALNDELKELGCEERLTKQELDSELDASLHLVFTVVYEFLPFYYPDEDTNLEFPDSGTVDDGFNLADHDIYKRGYIGKHYVPIAIRGLRFLERKGFF